MVQGGMYRPGLLRIVQAGQSPIYDSQQEDAPVQPPGTCYLPHACEEWIIGGKAEAEALRQDLEQALAIMQAQEETAMSDTRSDR